MPCRLTPALTILLGASLLLAAPLANAQHHGGGGHGMGGGGGLSGGGRATGVEDKDDLKDFHQALAVQATTQQSAEFEGLLKSTEVARLMLKALQQASKEQDAAELTRREAALGHAVGKARDDTKNFLAGFSDKQKSGLKEVTKRLTKADSDLAQQQSKLDQVAQTGTSAAPEAGSLAGDVDKALASFADQQLALGREMGIAAADPPQMAFTLPTAKRSATLGRQAVVVTVSGELSQTSAENGQHVFELKLRADLFDLQQNITQVLRQELNRYESCGQRVDIRQATLSPSAPASLLSVRLHYERWTCVRMSGQSISSELAEGDGAVDIRLTPMIEAKNLKLSYEPVRVDASGMLGEALRSGSLGEDLRDKAVESILGAIQAGTDFKVAPPPAAPNGATLQNAKFEEAGAGVLRVLLGGEIELSNEQTKALAGQLKETLSAQETAPK